MFSAETAALYDRIYAWKDYAGEVERLVSLLGTHSGQRPTLLDVACGTGLHLDFLDTDFRVEGLDISPELLAIARDRLPGVTFHQADMLSFDLGRKYDLITCLFSSIGYAGTLEGLSRAVSSMAAHLEPGGTLVIEPWFTPQEWRPDTVHGLYVDDPDLKIARISTSKVAGRMSLLDLHYLVGTPERTEHFVEHHELGLFTREEMTGAMEREGLSVGYDTEGLDGRGLYIGRS